MVMLVALFALAVTDLVVGVSNDAINFLNSAIGSRAVSMRSILIVASLGVAIGAIFSSGLMEVARKGIFMPGLFYFEEIMVIFMAVMITDVLLLDFFNSLGLPTSTTVSIVFELLGAAVSMAAIKVYQDSGEMAMILEYINTEKATQIIVGILLAVVIAFIIGAVVQYCSRLVFTFQYEKKINFVGGIFGGLSLTAILYFIFLKGITSITFVSEDLVVYLSENTLLIILGGFVFLTLLSQGLISLFKVNILKFIIIIGTFALALAFAGNDLVNFIGVPIAAWQSFMLWQEAYQTTGSLPSEFLMTGMAGQVPTPPFLLIIAGGVMVVTIWLSGKARSVVQTGVDLSRQSDGAERFSPNFISRGMVRYFLVFGNLFTAMIPRKLERKLDSRFEKDDNNRHAGGVNAPAFDMVRASVNLVVASILISIGTSLKIPLSTTYVTFMVAMGASLADRAWDRESAVYRVAGVVNVIGGWFVTALVAFTTAAVFGAIIYFGGVIAISILVGLAIFTVTRSAFIHSRKAKEEKSKKLFNRSDLISIQEMVAQTSENLSGVIARVSKMYTKTVDNLGLQDKRKLKKNKKAIKKLEAEIDELKGNVFYFIRSLDDNSLEASEFYILNIDYLQDMVQSIGFITRNSYKHVNNNHKNLKFSQLRELKKVDKELQVLFDDIQELFDSRNFEKIDVILAGKQELLNKVSDLIQNQVERIRTTETSPKNTMLYFGLLLETKDLIISTMGLLELFREFHKEINKEI